jgi:hypothetical protein
MDFEGFRRSLDGAEPPAGLGLAAQGLWWDAKGDWDRAHRCAQDQDDAQGAWVHAYLHRKEGDLANASYWYGKAGRAVPSTPLEQEWRSIAAALLEADRP